MKYYIVIGLLLTSCAQAFAQQPRVKQVEKYLTATGNEVERTQAVLDVKYRLFGSLPQINKCLMLDLPEFSDRGTREVMPFGYQLNGASEVALDRVSGNLAESTVRPFFNKSLFAGVSYQLCDSVVYGITLYYTDPDRRKKAQIKKAMDAFFKRADSTCDTATVYSDPDYAVKVFSDKVQVYSLYHYPVVESRYPGVSHKVWEGPYTYDTGRSSLLLAFYNQESKENNIQSAFKVHYKHPGTDEPAKMNRIRFILDDATYEYPLEIEREQRSDQGQMIEECDTRTFVHPEVMKAMARASKVTVELEGDGGRLSYQMPAFQQASLRAAYDYFRWNVTHPMAKYRAW